MKNCRQRDEEYERVKAELDGLTGAIKGQGKGGHLSAGRLAAHGAELGRLHQGLERVVAVDFFQAPNRAAAVAARERCREALREGQGTV